MRFNFCPNCGTKGSIIEETLTHYQCSNCGKDFWNSPVATVSALFLKDGQALFAKRGIEPNKGKYDFPGGFVDYNEDIYAACVREIEEETGVKVDIKDIRLLTGYTREYVPGRSVVDLMMVIKRWEGEFVPDDDVAALEWKPLEFMNSDEFAPQEYKGLDKKLASLD